MFPNGSFQSIRDIFKHDLEYKLYYWKDQSSGKVRSCSSFYIFCSYIMLHNFCTTLRTSIFAENIFLIFFFALQKEATTKSNTFEISVDNTNNYCFYIEATIPSRRENRTGQESMVFCTSVGRTILDGMYLVNCHAVFSIARKKCFDFEYISYFFKVWCLSCRINYLIYKQGDTDKCGNSWEEHH